MFAFITLCVRYRLSLSIALIWLLITETVLDIGLATLDGMRDGTMALINGTTWLIVAFYVPLMQVTLGLTVWQLITRRSEQLKP